MIKARGAELFGAPGREAQRARDEVRIQAKLAGAAGDRDDVPARGTIGTPSDPARAAIATRRDLTRLLGLVADGLAVGTVHLRAKGTIHVAGVAACAEGDWYVQRAVHSYRSGSTDRHGSYQTRFIATR